MRAPASMVEILERLDRIERHLRPRRRRPLRLTQELVDELLEWSERVRLNTRKWVLEQRRYLHWWMHELRGVNLRTATLEAHVLPALDRKRNARAPRIAVIKRLYSYLREERRLVKPAEDPTLDTLRVPQARPAQWRRRKAFDVDDYRRLRRFLVHPWKDAIDVLAGTGWHVTELERFARRGAWETRKLGRSAGVLVCPQTKGGGVLRTAVSRRVLDAGRRLRARGTLSEKWFRAAVRRAARAASLRGLTPGRFRHAVATWAINAGAEPAAVATFLNHRDSRTTRRFYAVHATPVKVPTLA